MKITADLNCYFTEAADVAPDKRSYRSFVVVASTREATLWKQITEAEKKSIEARAAIFTNQDITPEYLSNVDALINGISERINDKPMGAGDALKNKKYYPEFGNLIGGQATVGFRLQHGGVLYEVLQPHTFSAGWIPGTGTESLYKVVQEESGGTEKDPIAWKRGMELLMGKYYTDKGVLYKCVRDSGMGMSFDLADLVAGGYVEVIN